MMVPSKLVAHWLAFCRVTLEMMNDVHTWKVSDVTPVQI